MNCQECLEPIRSQVGVCESKNCSQNPIHNNARCQAGQCGSADLNPTMIRPRVYHYVCRTCGDTTFAHHTANGILYKKPN